jgi:predicted amidophosphoribosyltransferase
MKELTQDLNDLLELFFPALCITCGNRLITQENYLCVDCWQDLPVTNFHLDDQNKVAQLFWGRVRLELATSFFSYKKGSKYQKLIHFIKYKGMKELGFETGRKFGITLKESGHFNSVDFVVPVPLHPKKQKIRGYNQSDWISAGIAQSMAIPLHSDNLYRKIFTATQTRKNPKSFLKNIFCWLTMWLQPVLPWKPVPFNC